MIAEILIASILIAAIVGFDLACCQLFGPSHCGEISDLAPAGIWFGASALTFTICAIHFAMVLVHVWGCARLACWIFAPFLIFGQAVVAWLLFHMVRRIAAYVVCAKSAKETSD